MSQWWIVVPIVVFAAAYVVRGLLPQSRRRRSVPGSGCHDCAASVHGGRNADGAPVKR